jgi:hypothetical protein
MRAYGFVDWSGDSGFEFGLGSSRHLALAIGSSVQYADLQRELMDLRVDLGLPRGFEFHWARNAERVRTAFFSAPALSFWNGAVLLVDKCELSSEFARMREPEFYGVFLEYLLARLPLELLGVKRLLIDGVKKEETPIRAMRLAMSSALRRRGMGRTPILRAEPAHQWDGLQVADMLAGAVVERETGGRDYLTNWKAHLLVYQYDAVK